MQTLTLIDFQISITPAVIQDIKHCPVSPFMPNGAIPETNIIIIMGAESICNISSQTDMVTSQIKEIHSSFGLETQIQQAINEIASLRASVELNTSDSNIF